jgi:hypothetical protein
MNTWQKLPVIFLFPFILATAGCTTYQAQGGATGGAMGGIAGALLDHENPWRGGVIGATPGTLAGATISEVSVRGARQAAATDRPVEYTTENGRGVYHAEPVRSDVHSRCKKVRERVFQDGRLIKDAVREVCEG